VVSGIRYFLSESLDPVTLASHLDYQTSELLFLGSLSAHLPHLHSSLKLDPEHRREAIRGTLQGVPGVGSLDPSYHSGISQVTSAGPAPLVVDLPPPSPVQNQDPLVVELPPVDRPPIVIDAGPNIVAPGLSGGRGMFKRLIVACDGMSTGYNMHTKRRGQRKFDLEL
jgi:hypothetical protein